MQVSDMQRALKALCSQNLRNLTSLNPPSSLISCIKPPQNPNFSLYKTIHSTPRRLFGAEPYLTNSWISSNSLDNNNHNADSTTDSNPRAVTAEYDPISGRLVTRWGPKSGSEEDREPEPSNRGDEDVAKDRRYGSVRRENLGGRGGGGVQGLGLGAGSVYGNRKKAKSKVAWVCSSCGHSEGQWWGTCKACNSTGTMVNFVEGVYDGGKTSGFEVSENVVRTWLPNKGTEMVPLRLTDVNRRVNQMEWRIPL